MEPIRILIVDDHPLMREALCAVIEDHADMVVAGQGANGVEAVEQYQALQPDLTIMDLMMPGQDGLEAIMAILAINTGARILALTSSHEEAMFLAAVQAGALGYLQKDAQRTELIIAIREVAQGNAYVPPHLTRILLESIRRGTAGGQAQTIQILSPREREILAFLRQGTTNAEIAERLGLSEGTVRVHVHHILRKLGLENRHQAMLYAARHGV